MAIKKNQCRGNVLSGKRFLVIGFEGSEIKALEMCVYVYVFVRATSLRDGYTTILQATTFMRSRKGLYDVDNLRQKLSRLLVE